MKKILSILAVLIIILTACSGGDTGGDKVVKFYTFSTTAETEETLKTIISNFEEENPGIKVEYQMYPYADYFTALQTSLASGDGPDAFELNYESSVTYYENGAPADISTLTEDDIKSYYDETSYNAFRNDEYQFAVPSTFSTVVTYYNKELFDSAGVDYPTEDWTWENEVEAAQKIKSDSGIDYGLVSEFQYNEFYKTAAQNGGKLFDENGEPTINSKENIEALQYMIDLTSEGKYNVSPTQLEAGESEQLFVNGQTAMLTTGIWLFDSINNSEFEWDIVVEAGNTDKATHYFANGLSINKNVDEEQQKAAYEWIKYYTTNEKALELRLDSGEVLSSSNETIKDAYINVEGKENREIVFDSLNYGVTPPVPSNINNQEMQDAINGSLEAAKNGSMTAEEALNDAQQKVEKLIK